MNQQVDKNVVTDVTTSGQLGDKKEDADDDDLYFSDTKGEDEDNYFLEEGYKRDEEDDMDIIPNQIDEDNDLLYWSAAGRVLRRENKKVESEKAVDPIPPVRSNLRSATAVSEYAKSVVMNYNKTTKSETLLLK